MTTATTTRIAAFVEALEADSEMEYRYDQDSVAVMTEFGLSNEDQQVMLHGTIDEIREAMGPGTETYKIKRKPAPNGPV